MEIHKDDSETSLSLLGSQPPDLPEDLQLEVLKRVQGAATMYALSLTFQL
jgi:hypothetical protein